MIDRIFYIIVLTSFKLLFYQYLKVGCDATKTHYHEIKNRGPFINYITLLMGEDLMKGYLRLCGGRGTNLSYVVIRAVEKGTKIRFDIKFKMLKCFFTFFCAHQNN